MHERSSFRSKSKTAAHCSKRLNRAHLATGCLQNRSEVKGLEVCFSAVLRDEVTLGEVAARRSLSCDRSKRFSTSQSPTVRPSSCWANEGGSAGSGEGACRIGGLGALRLLHNPVTVRAMRRHAMLATVAELRARVAAYNLVSPTPYRAHDVARFAGATQATIADEVARLERETARYRNMLSLPSYKT